MLTLLSLLFLFFVFSFFHCFSANLSQVSPELFKQGVLEHAVWLGMDPDSSDKKYLWIAERSLVAPLPADWSQLKTQDEGHPYYYNEVTQESRWDHPSDSEYRELFSRKKVSRSPPSQ